MTRAASSACFVFYSTALAPLVIDQIHTYQLRVQFVVRSSQTSYRRLQIALIAYKMRLLNTLFSLVLGSACCT